MSEDERRGARGAQGRLAVDRARFLWLTAAIAGGCGPQVPAPQPLRVGGDYDTTAQGGSVEPVSSGEPAPADPATARPAPPPSATPPIAPFEEGGLVQAGPIDPSCEGMPPPDPGCEASMGFDAHRCSTFRSFVEDKAATTLMKCIVSTSKKKGRCMTEQAFTDCPKATLRAVKKPSASTAALCKPIVANCNSVGARGITQAQCQALLSVVQSSAQSDAITCMAEGCLAAECFMQLAWMRQ